MINNYIYAFLVDEYSCSNSSARAESSNRIAVEDSVLYPRKWMSPYQMRVRSITTKLQGCIGASVKGRCSTISVLTSWVVIATSMPLRINSTNVCKTLDVLEAIIFGVAIIIECFADKRSLRNGCK